MRIPANKPNITLRHGNKRINLKNNKSKQSPLQRISKLTNATSTPTLDPLYKAPWDADLVSHDRISSNGPPPKDSRADYEEEVTREIKEAEGREDVLVVATDGSRRRTRGAKRTGAGVVVKRGKVVIWKGAWGLGRRSNTYDGESFALAAGMAIAKQIADNDNAISGITIVSDSAAAISNITRTHTHPSQQLSILFATRAREFLEKGPDFRIRIRWVPGHKGIELNELADKEARRGCRREDSIQASLSYYREKATELVLRGWRKEFETNSKYSTFWESTNRPPTVKPSKTFRQLKDRPEVFGRLTQLRTMHGYNTYYYQRFNFTDRDWDCECGDATPPNPAAVREHIFHLCPLYAEERRNFLTPISRLHETMGLLGSDKGLLATAKFLELTGALTRDGRPYTVPEMPTIPSEVDISVIREEEPIGSQT